MGGMKEFAVSNFTVIEKRHSCRSFADGMIEGDRLSALREEIETCNRLSGLHIQLVQNDGAAFKGMNSYGSFKNVQHYLALVGQKNDEQLDEKIGYYGERIVLKATELGLGTCWVLATYQKRKCHAKVDQGEVLRCVVPIGFPAIPFTGKQRKTKSLEELSIVSGTMPDWFSHGMEAVRLAPSACNNQPVMFQLEGNEVTATLKKQLFATKIDLGIAEYHFEIGAAKPDYFRERKGL